MGLRRGRQRTTPEKEPKQWWFLRTQLPTGVKILDNSPWDRPREELIFYNPETTQTEFLLSLRILRDGLDGAIRELERKLYG